MRLCHDTEAFVVFLHLFKKKKKKDKLPNHLMTAAWAHSRQALFPMSRAADTVRHYGIDNGWDFCDGSLDLRVFYLGYFYFFL